MAAQPGAGRPTKYTPATVAKLTDALRGGNTRRASCAAAGIDQTTLPTFFHHLATIVPVILTGFRRVEEPCRFAHALQNLCASIVQNVSGPPAYC